MRSKHVVSLLLCLCVLCLGATTPDGGCQTNPVTPEQRIELETRVHEIKSRLERVIADPTTSPANVATAQRNLELITKGETSVSAAFDAMNVIADPTLDPGQKIIIEGSAVAPLTGPAAPWVELGSLAVGGLVSWFWRQKQVNGARDATSIAVGKLQQVLTAAQQIVDSNPSVTPGVVTRLGMPISTSSDTHHVVSYLKGQAQDPVLDELVPELP